MKTKFLTGDDVDMYMNDGLLTRVVEAFNNLNIDMFDYKYDDYCEPHLVDLGDHWYFQVRFKKNEGIMWSLWLGRRTTYFGQCAIGITAGEFQDLLDLFPIRLQRILEKQIRMEEE